jgi:cytochrome P450
VAEDHAAAAGLGAPRSEIADDPQPAYARWRAAPEPGRTEHGSRLFARSADVADILRRPEVFVAPIPPQLAVADALTPFGTDAAAHRRLRATLEPLFSLAHGFEVGKAIVRVVNELMDEFAYQGEIDFATQFSKPFAGRLLALLLGLPDTDVPDLLALNDGVLRPHELAAEPPGSYAANSYRAKALAALYDYFGSVIEQRRTQPGEDVLSGLLAAEHDGAPLPDAAVLHICLVLLLAAIDPMSAALDCVFLHLCRHPGDRALVVQNPALRRSLVEELLRWESPVMMVSRTATLDTSVGGCPVSAEEQVVAVLGAANSDPELVAQPDEFQPERRINPHLAFGGGIHRCLGSHVARLALRITLREWHARIPDYALAPGAQVGHSFGIRTTPTMPMLLGRPA